MSTLDQLGDNMVGMLTLQAKKITEQAATIEALRARIEQAFYDGFNSRSTYNDMDLRDVDDEWKKQKDGLLKIDAAAKGQG